MAIAPMISEDLLNVYGKAKSPAPMVLLSIRNNVETEVAVPDPMLSEDTPILMMK
jgi:hypothetical protein